MDNLLNNTRNKFKILDVLHNDLATVRTGRAAQLLVENIVINCTEILRNCESWSLLRSLQSTTDNCCTPFDGSIIGEIQRNNRNTRLNPVIDGQLIKLVFLNYLKRDVRNLFIL